MALGSLAKGSGAGVDVVCGASVTLPGFSHACQAAQSACRIPQLSKQGGWQGCATAQALTQQSAHIHPPYTLSGEAGDAGVGQEGTAGCEHLTSPSSLFFCPHSSFSSPFPFHFPHLLLHSLSLFHFFYPTFCLTIPFPLPVPPFHS